MTYVLAFIALMVVFVIYRYYNARRDMAWSKGKAIVAYGPAPLGHHFIFVDDDLNVAVFLPKSDGTLHIMIGTPVRAEYWQKYNEKGERLKAGKMKDAPEWKITQSEVHYRGGFLPKQGPPLKARIHKVSDFGSTVDSDFLAEKANEILVHMNEEGELPMRAI